MINNTHTLDALRAFVHRGGQDDAKATFRHGENRADANRAVRLRGSYLN